MAIQRTMDSGAELLTVSEVAAMLYIHPNTARRWVAQGILAAWRIGPRGDRRFLRSDVLQLLAVGSNGHSGQGNGANTA